MNPTNALYALARDVTEAGPDDVAFDGLRVLQHPSRMLQFLTGHELDIVPVTVQLWPSLSCDVRCPTCPYRLTDARDKADSDEQLHVMPLPLFKRLVASLKRAGVQSVFLTGGGEPLVHPELLSMVDELSSIGLGWGMFTNGITLTPEIAAHLLRAKPGFFRVSLDAGTAALYSKIYAAPAETFEHVKANVIEAGRVAARLGYNWFGVGFAVMPGLANAELDAMRDTFVDLIERSGRGVNFASFRPRVVHHRGHEVVVPQRWSGRYESLAQQIRTRIVEPVARRYGNAVRIDHKFGAFADCDRQESPRGGWGGSWIATLDHTASGSIVSHMTAASNNPTAWGDALDDGEFLPTWLSERRRAAQRLVLDGAVRLPVANGFRALDAFLERVRTIFPEPLTHSRAEDVLRGVESWEFHRSRRPIFVG
jgi:pyruvate-formate lyase-activating enzyme